MLREKQCKWCKKYFYYDDGVDDVESKPKRHGNCPQCIDPNSVKGETYHKGTMYSVFKYYMYSRGIKLPGEEMWKIMKENFPRQHSLFTKTSYRTITLPTGEIFDGRYGKFELGSVVERQIRGRKLNNRQIKCCRCGKVVEVSKMRTLSYYLGYHDKMCSICDKSKINRRKDGEGIYNHVGGRKKSDVSTRALAKALNISVMDFRRGNIPDSPILPLQNGIIINGLEIIRSYWDENPNIYAPKYVLRCHKCKQEFEVLQKNVWRLDHQCR